MFDALLGVAEHTRWHIKLTECSQFLLVFGYTVSSLFMIPEEWPILIELLVKKYSHFIGNSEMDGA